MITFNEFREKWDSMPVYGHGFLRIDGKHTIEINIGYEDLNQKTLLILNTANVGELPSTKSIKANNYQLYDGTWVISFRLIRNDNEEVFMRLCWDIIEFSRNFEKDVISCIVERYLKWQRLMEHERLDIMSQSRQKGLVGELLYLEELLEYMSEGKAVESWTGPEDADQDFVFDDTWTEVKAIAVSFDTVSISSLQQLDAKNEGTLEVYFIDKTAPNDKSGFTLFNIVDRVRQRILNDIKAMEWFETKLFMYGYIGSNEYDKQKYKLNGKSTYKVSATFPKLNKSNVASQIIAANYKISLSSIEEFKNKEI